LDELRRDVGMADIRRRHALLQLERPTIVAERDGLACRSLGRDNHARHDGSSVATPTAQRSPVRLRFALRFDTR